MTPIRLCSSRLALGLTLAFGLSACGSKSSPPPPPPPSSPAARPAARAAAKKKGKKKNPLQTYTKVEDVVPASEVATIRHTFHERDFTPDLSGTDNRDPFQSFVVNQPGIRTQGGSLVPATEQCTSKQMVATNYSLRDLSLVAIITRGLRRYALFQDTADVGHLATRADCLGKEKARVKEIGERSVVLEIVPDSNPNQPPRQPEVKSIALYPNELPIDAAGPGADRRGPSPAPRVGPRIAPPPPPPTRRRSMRRRPAPHPAPSTGAGHQ